MDSQNEKRIAKDIIIWQIIKEEKPINHKLSDLISELEKNLAIDKQIKITKSDCEKWKMYWSSEHKNTSRWSDKYKKIKLIEVSNFGQVKFIDYEGKEEIKNQVEYYDLKKGYLCLEGNYTDLPDILVYQMVANTWLIKDGNQSGDLGQWKVHHVTNNGYDNSVNNLVWVRQKLHTEIHKTYQ